MTVFKIYNMQIVPERSITIYVQNTSLKNRCAYCLSFKFDPVLNNVYDQITGTEEVSLNLNDVDIPLVNSIGNKFYSDKLCKGFCYNLRFGNNGLNNRKEDHFCVVTEPVYTRRYNPSGSLATIATDTSQKGVLTKESAKSGK